MDNQLICQAFCFEEEAICSPDDNERQVIMRSSLYLESHVVSEILWSSTTSVLLIYLLITCSSITAHLMDIYLQNHPMEEGSFITISKMENHKPRNTSLPAACHTLSWAPKFGRCTVILVKWSIWATQLHWEIRLISWNVLSLLFCFYHSGSCLCTALVWTHEFVQIWLSYTQHDSVLWILTIPVVICSASCKNPLPGLGTELTACGSQHSTTNILDF